MYIKEKKNIYKIKKNDNTIMIYFEKKLLKFIAYKANGIFSDIANVKRKFIDLNIKYEGKINKELIILI